MARKKLSATIDSYDSMSSRLRDNYEVLLDGTTQDNVIVAVAGDPGYLVKYQDLPPGPSGPSVVPRPVMRHWHGRVEIRLKRRSVASRQSPV